MRKIIVVRFVIVRVVNFWLQVLRRSLIVTARPKRAKVVIIEIRGKMDDGTTCRYIDVAILTIIAIALKLPHHNLRSNALPLHLVCQERGRLCGEHRERGCFRKTLFLFVIVFLIGRNPFQCS